MGNADQSSWWPLLLLLLLLPPAHQIPQAAGAGAGCCPRTQALPGRCALLGRRVLGTIGDPCCRSTGPSRRAQQSIPQSPNLSQFSPGRDFQGSPKFGTLSTYPRPRDQPGHRLNQRPGRPDLSSIYLLLVLTACLCLPKTSRLHPDLLPPTTSQSETFIPSALSHLSTPSWFHCN